jgi:peptidyl-prolyl cis-trans isomerase C
LAQAIRKTLIAGANVSKLAKQHSDCPSKAKERDLGTLKQGMMVGPFEEAAFTRSVNVIGPIVQTKFGYHIVRVTEREE